MLAFLAALALSGNQPSSMTFLRETDPMTDEVLSMAVVTNQSQGLGIGCRGRDQSLRIVFMAGRHLASTNWLTASRRLMFRFDDDEPVTTEWYYRNDLVQQYSGPQLRRFVRRLLTASRVMIRAYDYSGRAVDAEFRIVNPAGPIREALAACDDRRANEVLGPLLPSAD